MENNKINVEEIIKNDLYQYLTSKDLVDQHLPEAPDLEQLWAKVGESYLPDALREFNKYPTVSLGWIMKELSATVAECAARTFHLLIHQNLQPGTEEAFRGFIAALHQMYLMGISMELKDLGYHMTQLA